MAYGGSPAAVPPDRDAEHLRLLSIFHYVFAGLMAFGGTFPVIHLVVGVGVMFGGLGTEGEAAFRVLFGAVFVVVALLLILMGWSLAVLAFVAARCLRQHRRHLFCMIVAGISCLCMPLGTVLGVFTLIVLDRASVRRLFGVAPEGEESAPPAS